MNTFKANRYRPNNAIGMLGLALVLSACGGGGKDAANNSSTAASANTPAPDAQIVAYLQASNIDNSPGGNGRPAGTWRWPNTPAQHVAVYLPLPTAGNATEQDYASKVATGVAFLNGKLSGLLVLDLTNSRPASGSFIQVSYLTSYVPLGSTDYSSYCANVAIGPGIGATIVPDVGNNITGTVYVNLGNGHCDVTQDIVTHEFGHALGLATHFPSFGDAPVNGWTSAYYDVLATLYGNPQSTVAANIVVKRAKT